MIFIFLCDGEPLKGKAALDPSCRVNPGYLQLPTSKRKPQEKGHLLNNPQIFREKGQQNNQIDSLII